jgi:hypothetical protein
MPDLSRHYCRAFLVVILYLFVFSQGGGLAKHFFHGF